MRLAIAAAYAAAVAFVACTPAGAQSVTLSSPDGGVIISGRLLTYDGDVFRIDSVYGVLTIDGRGVTCAGAECPMPGPFVPELTISGAPGAINGLMPPLLEAFAAATGREAVRQEEGSSGFLYVLTDRAKGSEVGQIHFRATSSAEAFADLISETADVAVAFREPSAEERAMAEEARLGDLSAVTRSGVLALDGLVAVVAPENRVRAVGQNDLVRIKSGELRSWSALGGAELPITLHLPPAGSALDAQIAERLPAGPAAATPRIVRHATLAALDRAVSQDPQGLGITVFSALGESRALAIAGICGAPLPPSRIAIKTEDYPLSAPHYFFTPDIRPPKLLSEFLAYTRGAAAQAVIRRAGYVDQGIEVRDLPGQGDRLIRAILATGPDVSARDLRRAVEALRDAEQVSLTFRFTDGSAELDTQSRANVTLLAGAIARGDLGAGTVILAGFSDGQGSGKTNVELSRRRADTVRAALLEALPDGADGIRIVADGFGEAMPVACDEEPWGREINRRVELWFRPD